MADDDVSLDSDGHGQVDGGRLCREAVWVYVRRRVGERQDDGIEEDASFGVIAWQVIRFGVGQDVVGQAGKSADEDGAEDHNDVYGRHGHLKMVPVVVVVVLVIIHFYFFYLGTCTNFRRVHCYHSYVVL